MIPNAGCDPNVNLLVIGAVIISLLKSGPMEITEVLNTCSKESNVSIDHVILTLDWLFSILAIKSENSLVSLK